MHGTALRWGVLLPTAYVLCSLLYLISWRLFWSRPTTARIGQVQAISDWRGFTALSSIFWPLGVVGVVIAMFVIWPGRWLFSQTPSRLWGKHLDGRDNRLMKRLRKNPDLLGKLGHPSETQINQPYGQLWNIQFRDASEPLWVLRVTDTTTKQTHLIRVPPRIGRVGTSHQAVAWSFGTTANMYNPIRES